MTNDSINNVEARFLSLRKEYTEEQWRNPDILNERVDSLIQVDLPLAYRLMQRVKNLRPDGENKRQLMFLKKQMRAESPELMEISSTHDSRLERAKMKASEFTSKAAQVVKTTDWQMMKKPLFVAVILPFLLFTFYQIVIASERFESRTQLIIKQPDGMSTLDPAMAFMSGFTGSVANNDNELVKAFILSSDMLEFLQQKVNVLEHYTDTSFDYFSRLSSSATREDLHEYFNKMVAVEIDELSGVITLSVQGFEPQFAQTLTRAIVERSEWYINEIGHSLAKEQLRFVEVEHKLVEQRLQDTKSSLLSFQRKHNLLDPEAEGMAFQQITYRLEGEIAAKQAQLSALLSGMSEKAPAVMRARAELQSLEHELEAQRARLTTSQPGSEASVGEILAKFSDLKIDLELALKAYTASQVSLEKSRIEAYRQLKYLVVVESPTLPEEAKYPQVIYNLTLFLAVTFMLFFIGRIIMATVNELR